MGVPMWLWLALATFVSEDAACVAAGALIQTGALSAPAGVAACAVGILAGDLGLWGLGRYGRSAASAFACGRRVLARGRSPALESALRRGAAVALIASRFLPGTRLPLYIAAGLSGVSLSTFAGSTALAVSLWTPLLVLTSAGVAGAATRVALPTLPSSPVWFAGAIAFIVSARLARVALQAVTAAGRACVATRLAARVARLWQWEFWPMWAFYPPVALWIAWLALRHGGLSTMTAANPGIPDGGTVGESKADILSHLPSEAVIPFRIVLAAPLGERRVAARRLVGEAGWVFPLVLKPDVGERGRGLRLAHTAADVDAYCDACPAPFLIQPYHPGPYEAGVFYYRLPGESHGRILSITDKQFPAIVGDGVSTVEALVWAHPRYRMQAPLFLTRHAGRRHQVLAAGERFPLAVAGNHSKGTMFLMGEHLRTPALEERIDSIARAFPGFFIGRFDIRYRDVEAFKAGIDLAIVELNGATAEPTDLYDPRTTLWSAYRKLAHQWTLVFEIGAANRRRGAGTTPVLTLVSKLRSHVALPALLAD